MKYKTKEKEQEKQISSACKQVETTIKEEEQLKNNVKDEPLNLFRSLLSQWVAWLRGCNKES